jgi:hypothetical protein
VLNAIGLFGIDMTYAAAYIAALDSNQLHVDVDEMDSGSSNHSDSSSDVEEWADIVLYC